jgi:hypothetical protein
MATFNPSPNITIGDTSASGSLHTFVGDLHVTGDITVTGSVFATGGIIETTGSYDYLSASVGVFGTTTTSRLIGGSPLTISASVTTISGNLLICNGTASISNLSGCSPIVVHAPMSSSFNISASSFWANGVLLAPGGGGSTDVSDVDDDNVYQLVGVSAAGTGVTLTTDDDAPITFNPSTTTLQANGWQYRGSKFAASGSFGPGGSYHGIVSFGDDNTDSVLIIRSQKSGEERLTITNNQGPLLLSGSGVGIRLASPVKVSDDCSFTFISDATVDIGTQNQGLRTLYTTDMSASAIKVSGNLGSINYMGPNGPVTESYGGKLTLGAYDSPYIQSQNTYIDAGPGLSWNSLAIRQPSSAGQILLTSSGMPAEFPIAAIALKADSGDDFVEITTNAMQTILTTGSLSDDKIEYAWTVEEGDQGGAWLRLDLDANEFIIERVPLVLGSVGAESLAGNSYYLGLNSDNQVVRTSSAGGGGGGSVAGSDTQVQFNQNGGFGANSNFTYNGTGSVGIGLALNINGGSNLTVNNITYNGSNAQIWTLKDDLDGFGSNGPLLFFTGSGGDLLKFSTSGSRKGVVFPRTFYPSNNNSVDMGDSTYGFRNIFCVGQIDARGAGDGAFAIELPNNKNEALMIRDQTAGSNWITLGTQTGGYRVNISKPTVIGADESLSPKITLDVHYSGSGSPTNLANQVGGGEVVYFGTGSLANVGGVHYLNSDGGWAPVNSDATGSGHNQLLGIALGTYVSSSGMLVKGYFNVTSSHFVGGFIKGGPVYIRPGSNEGKMTGSAPTGSDEYVRVIGYGTDTANVVYFNPDSTYIELA